MRRFPTVINKESKEKTVHHAIPSGLERALKDKPDFTSMLTFAEDVLFIGAISRKRLSSLKIKSTTLHRKAFRVCAIKSYLRVVTNLPNSGAYPQLGRMNEINTSFTPQRAILDANK